jgi:aryl-alcohol dehydrogenase-like predicted oxidoreductase
MELRKLGDTGLRVSPLGLGTVKLGRNEGVKYPTTFTLPSDREVRDLLSLATDLGINLLDTAPAYGSSEQRLGRLLPGPRDRWVLSTKVGEMFSGGRSSFDFSAMGTRCSVERSLSRLHTDYLDIVLIHSSGEDLEILEHSGVLEELQMLRRQGLIRAVGMSTKTVAGGQEILRRADLAMVTCNPVECDQLPVLVEAARIGKGVLIKKALGSGHLHKFAEADPVEFALRFVFDQPGVSSVVLGTINPDHLRHNVAVADRVLAS